MHPGPWSLTPPIPHSSLKGFSSLSPTTPVGPVQHQYSLQQALVMPHCTSLYSSLQAKKHHLSSYLHSRSITVLHGCWFWEGGISAVLHLFQCFGLVSTHKAIAKIACSTNSSVASELHVFYHTVEIASKMATVTTIWALTTQDYSLHCFSGLHHLSLGVFRWPIDLCDCQKT